MIFLLRKFIAAMAGSMDRLHHTKPELVYTE